MFQNIYVLENKILGKDGFGKVYLGKDIENNKYVALKEIKEKIMNNQEDKKEEEGTENQILIPSQIKNENIVNLLDLTKIDNKNFLVFEYCNEGDLSRYIKYFK